jgi:hypothetical protein
MARIRRTPFIVRETPQLRALAEEAKVLARAGTDRGPALERLRTMAGGDYEMLRRASSVAAGRDPESVAATSLLSEASHDQSGMALEHLFEGEELALLRLTPEEGFSLLVSLEPRLGELEAEVRSGTLRGVEPTGLISWLMRHSPPSEERDRIGKERDHLGTLKETLKRTRQLVGPSAPGQSGLLAADAALGVATRHLATVAGFPLPPVADP